MTDGLTKLSDTDLRELILAIKSNRITQPYSQLQLASILASDLREPVVASLSLFSSLGFEQKQLVAMLELLQADRGNGRNELPNIDLVTSGPEAPGITNRDTAVVVRELFAHAKTSVLVVGYAVYQGQSVFEALAKRMKNNPGLAVELFLDIARPKGDSTKQEILVSRFIERFRNSQWPAGFPLPQVYYDPRSSSDESNIRSSLHAKCIVVDLEHVFVSSANFTEAGQERNLEVGLSIRSSWLAEKIVRHFHQLRQHKLVQRAAV